MLFLLGRGPRPTFYLTRFNSFTNSDISKKKHGVLNELANENVPAFGRPFSWRQQKNYKNYHRHREIFILRVRPRCIITSRERKQLVFYYNCCISQPNCNYTRLLVGSIQKKFSFDVLNIKEEVDFKISL